MHQAPTLQCGLEHRQGRGDADAATDQYQRFVASAQGELARWREQLDSVAFDQLLVQVVGDLATRFALDADAVLTGIAQGRQRIVTTLLLTIDEQLQANVLAR
ncbi:hypothetical protein D3C79_726680 [compost metagenome]